MLVWETSNLFNGQNSNFFNLLPTFKDSFCGLLSLLSFRNLLHGNPLITV